MGLRVGWGWFAEGVKMSLLECRFRRTFSKLVVYGWKGVGEGCRGRKGVGVEGWKGMGWRRRGWNRVEV